MRHPGSGYDQGRSRRKKGGDNRWGGERRRGTRYTRSSSPHGMIVRVTVVSSLYDTRRAKMRFYGFLDLTAEEFSTRYY